MKLLHVKKAVLLSALLLANISAQAVQITRDSKCTKGTSVAIEKGQEGVVFKKMPESEDWDGKTATIVDTGGNGNEFSIPARSKSCFYKKASTSTYCFTKSGADALTIIAATSGVKGSTKDCNKG